MDQSPADCDVAVIGGGPGGSTIAALLAQKGYRVTVFEKDRHPRFHIGESLLPMNLELFEKLGVSKQVAAIGMVKRCAEFYTPDKSATQSFAFAEAFDERYPYAYQVRRSEFDEVLLRNAQSRGAQVREGWRVTGVEFAADRLTVTATDPGAGEPAHISARYLVDATGRDTFLAGKLGIKHRNPKHTSAALYSHFRNVIRSPGDAEGNIAIYWFDHGWFWFIPLADGATSIGAVCWPYYLKTRRADASTFLRQTIALCPALEERLVNAEMVAPATATGNYSYVCDHMAGDRYIMVGDAFAFIDPVFSSGVLLAMRSSFLGAEVVDGSLKNPAMAARLNREFDRVIRRALRRFSWMIYRITTPVMRGLVLNPADPMGVKRAVISLLAGDVYRNGPVWWRLLVFRVIYYALSLMKFGDSLRAWRRRKIAVIPQAIQATDGSG